MKMQKGEAITVFALVMFLSFIGVSVIAANNNSKAEKMESASSSQQK